MNCPQCNRLSAYAWSFGKLPRQEECEACGETFAPGHLPLRDRIYGWLWIWPVGWFYDQIIGRIDTWFRILLCRKIRKARDSVSELEKLQKFGVLNETFAQILSLELNQARRQAARKNV